MNKKIAACGSVVLFFLAALALVAVILATAYVTTQPTTGLDLALQIRQAQIEQQQANTARTLAEASKLEAEARAVDRQSMTDTFDKFANVALAGGVCLGGLLFIGAFAFTMVTIISEVKKTIG